MYLHSLISPYDSMVKSSQQTISVKKGYMDYINSSMVSPINFHLDFHVVFLRSCHEIVRLVLIQAFSFQESNGKQLIIKILSNKKPIEYLPLHQQFRLYQRPLSCKVEINFITKSKASKITCSYMELFCRPMKISHVNKKQFNFDWSAKKFQVVS